MSFPNSSSYQNTNYPIFAICYNIYVFYQLTTINYQVIFEFRTIHSKEDIGEI